MLIALEWHLAWASLSGMETLALAAIAPVRDPLIYARVDLVRDDRGGWQVSELELIEPSLFFDHAPHALHETRAYARWAEESGSATPYADVRDADAAPLH